MMTDQTIVILSAARTPIGSFLGSLKDISGPKLGELALLATVERSGITKNSIDAVYMGCVLSAGLGQAPARQAALAAGLGDSVVCATVNKMCGSGMMALMMAHDAILAGTHSVVAAGGMESMTMTPYLISKGRSGYRMGHGVLIDHMFIDGLEDAYDKGKLMGYFADITAKQYHFTRESQDEFAITSLKRAKLAADGGYFKQEITPVNTQSGKLSLTVDTDEGPQKANLEKIPHLKPAFGKDGTVTAANASSISDGAASLLLSSMKKAKQLNLPPLAKIVAHQTHAQEPNWFTTAPVGAIRKLLAKLDWSINDVDLFEINEAFAVVTLAAMHELNIPHEKVNIHGGACALGHPIGASGARVVVTLLHALQKYGLKRGIAALCIGGGEATAIAVEMI